MTENCALKLQLEEYKAELSLKSIEVNNNINDRVYTLTY